MDLQSKIIGLLVACLMNDPQLVRATKYVSEKQTIKVTRRRYKRGSYHRTKSDRGEFLVTAGRPNFAERLFIKRAKKAGEPFPVKKIQLKYAK